MAETLVRQANGLHGLRGSRDVDLEGIDPTKYDVFITDKDLAAARAAYPNYDWFICFSVKDKQGNFANVTYTLNFNRPNAGKSLYYFFNGKATRLDFVPTPKKGSHRRAKATLSLGDPAVGMG